MEKDTKKTKDLAVDSASAGYTLRELGDTGMWMASVSDIVFGVGGTQALAIFRCKHNARAYEDSIMYNSKKQA